MEEYVKVWEEPDHEFENTALVFTHIYQTVCVGTVYINTSDGFFKHSICGFLNASVSSSLVILINTSEGSVKCYSCTVLNDMK